MNEDNNNQENSEEAVKTPIKEAATLPTEECEEIVHPRRTPARRDNLGNYPKVSSYVYINMKGEEESNRERVRI